MAKAFVRKNEKRSVRELLLPLLLFACLLGLFIFGIGQVGKGTAKRQKEALENALTKGITECYAEEGRYPSDLYELIERYDLHYNEERFFVDFSVRGAGLRPVFTVLEREGAS